jgi:hypothetical protein
MCSGAACFHNMLTAVRDYLGGTSADPRRPVGVKEATTTPRPRSISDLGACSDKVLVDQPCSRAKLTRRYLGH